MNVICRAAVAAALGGVCLVPGSLSGQLTPLFVVNTYTSSGQYRPAVAASAGARDFLIVFRGVGAEGQGIYAKPYNVSGSPTASQFRVATATIPQSPGVAASAASDFLVVWTEDNRTMARLFQPGLSTAPFNLSSDTSLKSESAVAGDDEGNFVAVWSAFDANSLGVYGQRVHLSTFSGSNFRVNTYSTGDQRNARVALAPDGNRFVAVWNGSGASDDGVFGRLFEGSGAPLGAEFRVNTTTTGIQAFPAVGMHANGDFVVVWQSGNFLAHGLFGQRFSADGAPKGSEFRVTAQSTDLGNYPQVGVDSSGGFVVTWESLGADGSDYGVVARSFTANGAPLGGQTVVNNAHTTSIQRFPAIAPRIDSNFVIAWQSLFEDGSSYGISGAVSPPTSTDRRVNTSTPGNQVNPSVAYAGPGSFLVVWDSQNEVFGQRFTSAGAAAGAEFRVNTHTEEGQSAAALAGSSAGFVVAWQSSLGTYYGAIEAQRFSPAGVPLGLEFQVNAVTPVGAYAPSVAAGDNGFVVVWHDLNDIRARRYNSVGVPLSGDIAIKVLPFSVTLENQKTNAASDAAGNFLVSWVDKAGLSSYQVMAQLYASGGAPVGGQFRVNTGTDLAHTDAHAAFAPNGGFVVVWTDQSDGHSTGVFGRRFSSAGAPLGPEFRVHEKIDFGQSAGRVAWRPLDGFVVTWSSDDGSETGVFGRRFSSSGVPLATEFRLNAFTPSRQVARGAAAGPGQFTVVWQGYPEGGGYGVYVSRTELFANGDVNGDGAVNISDILYLINFLFAGGPGPVGPANVNGDAGVNVSDVLYLINFLFAGGSAPV